MIETVKSEVVGQLAPWAARELDLLPSMAGNTLAEIQAERDRKRRELAEARSRPLSGPISLAVVLAGIAFGLALFQGQRRMVAKS